MTETKPKESQAQQPLRAAKNLRELIQPAITGMLIDRFFQGDAESYFLTLGRSFVNVGSSNANTKFPYSRAQWEVRHLLRHDDSSN